MRSGAHTSRHRSVGLDRLVRLEWLERTANLVLAGGSPSDVKAALKEQLKPAFRSHDTTVRGSIDKTITILKRTWVSPPADLRPLQEAGLRLLSSLPREEHVPVHWGMIMSVYPFWGAVAAHVGRLLRLQGNATAAQVQRRAREEYGERETVSRRVRYVLRSYVQWGVLKESSTKGIYAQGPVRSVEPPELVAWLVEACLRARPDGPHALNEILGSASLFPFRLSPLSAQRLTEASERLDALRQGGDREWLVLR